MSKEVSIAEKIVAFSIFAIALLLVVAIGFAHVAFPERLASVGLLQTGGLRSASRGSIYANGELLASGVNERIYPLGANVSHLVGYYNSDHLLPVGAEYVLSETLEGDGIGWQTNVLNYFNPFPETGNDVELTIDLALQERAVKLIGERRGAIFAFDPTTGAVKVHVSSPSFDPNELAGGAAALIRHADLLNGAGGPLTDRVTASVYPPASVFKIITASALIEGGATSSSSYASPSYIVFEDGRTRLSNFNGAPCGDGHVTLAEAFARSCNTTFALASDDITADALTGQAAKWGFGHEFSYLGKTFQSVPPSSDDGDVMRLSAIGQHDIRVTPFHMALVAAAVANEGVVNFPHIVKHVQDSYGFPVTVNEERTSEVWVRPEITDELKQMMVDAVEKEYGTAHKVYGRPGAVAMKTGTGESGGPEQPQVAWAVGFAPVETPKYAFAVLIEGDDKEPYPLGGRDAAVIAASLFAE
ncbi:penicillin-binding transpeptidase domain-containing protein [Buchananella felis]|uniref:penicillin-binding transpeptidase domain-containing protein n=1 Tax=Buchananella felis TaxID=3231492 RepID=UPI0035280CEE